MAAARPRLVLATANPGKVAELRQLLGDRFDVVPRPPDLPETVEDGHTLEDNARKKAAEVTAHTGAPALADDTGLFVAALDGAPGVRSARYAGEGADTEANIDRLLAQLATRPPDGPGGHRAEFRTVVILTRPGGPEAQAEGRVAGTIVGRRRGRQGFGYDPVFAPDEGDGRTFGEMGPDEKARISHRSRALAALLAAVEGSDRCGRGESNPQAP